MDAADLLEARKTEEDVLEVFRAIRRENLAALKQFLDDGLDVETRGGRFHGTLVLEACRYHAVKAADLLLERGAAAAVSGGGFWTPLHYACDGEEAAGLAIKLIRRGADVDAADFYGRTPLHIASKQGSSNAALALLEAGAEPNTPDDGGRTPMHYAASFGRREAIAVLLSFGADVASLDRELDSPLHVATRERQSLAMSLLERTGADPEAENCWGELAGTLAPSYKMNPAALVDDADGGNTNSEPCVACSAKKGRHYYFCKSEILQEVPDDFILGPDGLPISSRGDQ